MPNRNQRQWLFIIIAIAVTILLTLLAAPNSGRQDIGSTYTHNPYGYKAWYEYMLTQPVSIKRWQKPFSEFIKDNPTDVAYIQIRNQADFQSSKLLPHSLNEKELAWVGKGNTLVIIGEQQTVTAAPFKSLIPYRDQPLFSRQIIIETTRRHQPNNQTKPLLADSHGAVVWKEEIGAGKIIYSATPYLAANAYQEFTDNYGFLADLVDGNQNIWVDEYIHGYKDKETLKNEQQENVLTYLIKTPLFLLFIQMIVISCIAVAAAFRRFGKPTNPKTVYADNSTAYIEALAGVLEKANSTDFVVETIGKDEQKKLQAALGLGESLVDHQTLISVWQQQHNKPASELNQLLQVNQSKSKITETQLLEWIQRWEKINFRG